MEIYNLRVGDLLFSPGAGPFRSGLIYKLTEKYAYYALCSTSGSHAGDKAFLTKEHKISKKRIFQALHRGELEISYAVGIGKRRKIP